MAILTGTTCYHCGNDCYTEEHQKDEKSFCCTGCFNVYTILSKSKLGNYYQLNQHPGETQVSGNKQFAYLDEPEIIQQLIDYTDEQKTIISLYVPAIHCSSCIWLLEHLYTLHPGILENRVDFLKKQVYIQFNPQQISLRALVELMSSIGYEPLISLQDVVKKSSGQKDNLSKKIAVAGFCFGNVMLLSFPAYFGLSETEAKFGEFFSLLNILFCIPAFFYSGKDYFVNAWQNLKVGVLNIDFPLALGIFVLFVRTIVEYVFHTGHGFADTLTGLVFFLLIGRFMQQKTYYHLSFERDYRSFFPVAVQVLNEDGSEKSVALEKLAQGDRILIKNQEIIPADAILLKGDALIDFSFVTGESLPVSKTLGEIIYAGGRQTGSALELEVIKPVSQSYLTKLWNNEVFQKQESTKIKTFSTKVSHYFSIALLALAFGTLLFWLPQDWRTGLSAFTAILIIACPCALALSTPFTMSAALSILDKNKFYLKNTDVVEQLAAIDTIVFDKTGTVSIAENQGVIFKGQLNHLTKDIIYAACKNSSHPHSRRICSFLGHRNTVAISHYQELTGKGISAIYDGKEVLIGSRQLIIDQKDAKQEFPEVHIKIGEQYIGFFELKQRFRKDLDQLLSNINKNYHTYLLSGDSNQDAEVLQSYFKSPFHLQFKQSPQDKLNFIEEKQEQQAKVMMIGDGLNDSGALKQSDAGIAVTDHINNFTPGSDAILDGSALHLLPQFLKFSKSAVKVIHISFGISLTYNIIGLSVAVTGQLSPLFAAILMPLSTVTIISFTSLATHYMAKKHQLS
ncbi:HAD-IC family P-type ATPase [Pedobacter aquae]|uniref:HAD-IC family P-type ATPase n=1 Tax=Pedobacter aquae TaxID=2605747 RepID=A0A5C0VFG3_9SPHI|nr:heavy metal translocating P-type ATPase metal-binding domain-containing protein [Pedobacter aquae]QEK51256.1 HAD-IC family P-type ATPase [Pedobacter aquae]